MKSIFSSIPENVKRILAGVLVVTIVWHVIISLTSKVQLSGLFMSKPEVGYTWEHTEDADSRFFWNNKDVEWKAGTAHPEFQVETTEKKGDWRPLPGYKFVDRANGLETVWEAGLLHPDFQAWSDTGEGLWIPATGYKFVYEGDEFVATEWDPNKRYEDLKIISQEEQDSFIPFPGYQFVNPGKTFDVVWTPGLVHSDNHKLVSGQKEGSWEVNYRPASESYGTWLGKEISRAVIYRAF